MDPAEAAGSLARRLRALRVTAWPDVTVTQRQVAVALGVSEPSVSSWEKMDGPVVPPTRRLRDYARLFATPRSIQGKHFRLLDSVELNDVEHARRLELERELLRLRTAAVNESADETAGQSAATVPDAPRQLRELLLDQHSLMQHLLTSVESYVTAGTSDVRSVCERLIRLLRAAPWLVSSTVITDNQLSIIEAEQAWCCVWVVSNSDSIEFEYPAAGPSFAPVVLDNLARGVTYRYLVPWSDRAVGRASILTAEYESLEVRFLDENFFRNFTATLDQLVVYEAEDRSVTTARAYYLYPGSNPRRWVVADDRSSQYRLQDLKQAWRLAKEAS